MKYSELLQFDPVGVPVRLGAAADEGAARRLVSSFLISAEMATRLTAQIFPQLQFERPLNARALLLVGPPGVGKSHLLAVVTSLAERGELAEAVTNRNVLTVGDDARAAGSSGLETVAGRFRVVRAALEPTARSLREVLLDCIEHYLSSQGVAYAFPAASRLPRQKPAIDAMMAAFHQTFPEHGLMLAVDDLLDFLKSRKTRDLDRDLDFLSELNEACHNLKFRFITSAQEPVSDHPQRGAAAECLRSLQGHCTEIVLGTRDIQFVATSRLVRKTPEQRALVEQHLARFAPYYGGMKERMGEFVDLYPLHPDYIPLFDQRALAVQSGALQVLSEAVAGRLEETVPEDEPGIIACDSRWPAMRADLRSRPGPEIAAVIRFSQRLEERLEQSAPPRANRAMARRIIHALSLRRLTADDMYGEYGATPAELRDSLCLYQPGLDVAEGEPAEVLLAQVRSTLEEIRQSVSEPLITVRCHQGRYDLHFRKFRRFNNPELFLHWANAVPFLLLLLTGGIMLGSRFSHLDRQMLTWTVIAHKACALTWLCLLPLSVLSRLKPHWAHLRLLLDWGAKDAAWMIQSLRSLYNKKAVIPPAGRFNTGQKINASLVALYYFGFVATGLLMYARGTILFPWYIHTALFFSAMGPVGGHLFLALVNPSTRIALGGIFHGWAPMKYIEHHHALSLPPSLQSHIHPVSVHTTAQKLFLSRVEIGVLVGTFLLAGAGLYAFGVARMATVKQQFAKSFADVIQPSELTTKHRIGPTAESCLKCHLLKGQIPDWKCEQCHKDVKERRTEELGYHGSLKGDCRFCHREHRERTVTLVPLNQDKFDHTKALFKLEGKHTEVKCDDCHKKTRKPDTPGIYFLGLAYEKCADCHRDQHAGQFVASCETCHRSPAGWTGSNMIFRHETGSNFPLLGLHASVECHKCHQPPSSTDRLGFAKFKGLARDCAGCHEDPHRKQFATRCADCHTPEGWGGRNLNFDHNKDSKFPLVAKHAEVACEKCHRPAKFGEPLGLAQFRGLKTECADCHQDPHRGQFARDCTKCHLTPDTWKVSAPQFVHDRDTKFTLLGKHAAVQCIKCHKPRAENGALASALFKGVETSCEKCHSVQHPKSYGSTCTACHTPAAWTSKQPPFDHARNTGFELVGRHFVAKCSACHSEAIFGVLNPARRAAFTCFTCHKKEDPHKGTLGTNCSKCHSSIGWKGEDLIFDHNTMARFALDRDHINVACAKCHKDGRWTPVDTACASCHTKFFLDSKK